MRFDIRASFFGAATLLLAVSAAPVSAAAVALDGTWSGSGYIKPTSGHRERIRCRVTFDRQSPKVFGVRATCASSSNSVRQTGEVLMIRPNYYAGDFYNRQYDMSGRIRVRVTGSTQTVTFSGESGRGKLRLHKQ